MDPMQPPAGIRIETIPISSVTLGEIATVAERAFADDPFFEFLMPSDRTRRRGLRIFFRASVAVARNAATVYGARDDSGRLVGVAVFVRPGAYPLPIAAQVRQAVSAGWALLPRPAAFLPGVRYLLAIDKSHPKEELWYLLLLAVDPAVQRGGIGGVLQQQVYPSADAEGLASYLETQKADNLGYYRRFGYEVVDELRPVSAGPPLWTMRREPRPPES